MNATIPAMDSFSAQHTSTPFATVDESGVRYYASESLMRRDRRNEGARLMMLDRATGEWTDCAGAD